MTDITAKLLHEQTGRLLDRARQGEKFRIIQNGRPDAFLLPASEKADPEWSEIMAEVWKAQKRPGPKRSSPILKERKARNQCLSFTLILPPFLPFFFGVGVSEFSGFLNSFLGSHHIFLFHSCA